MGETVKLWLKEWLGIAAIEREMAEDTAAIKQFAEAVQARALTQIGAKAQDKPKVLSGAALRRANDRWNSEHVFAPREQTNSEVLKEQANGRTDA